MNPSSAKPAAPRERKERFTTLGGIPLKAVYTEEDLAGSDPETSVGFPGEFPYTRGIYPTMYRGRLWTMRQYAGFGTAAQSNQRFRYLLTKGQTGLSVAFDLPTQIGMIPIILARRAKSVKSAWPSIRWRTWKRCSREFRWKMFLLP